MKIFGMRFLAAAFLLAALVPAARGEEITVDLMLCQSLANAEAEAPVVEEVALKGKVNHFGARNFHATVPGVKVWIAECPATKDAGIESDDAGWWTMKVRKIGGIDFDASFIYQKEGWPTTKSNVIPIGDEDNIDLAIQYIDPDYYYNAMKPLTEKLLASKLPPEEAAGAKLHNALVGTVGKSWASMHDDRLPHGDPGAKANKIDGAIGPIYFDEFVKPNTLYTKTSVDGGVAWINAPVGVHTASAKKKGFEYVKATFVVAEEDAASGVELYIASPPDSIQGTNDSAPGEP